jgi:hypothetical protein
MADVGAPHSVGVTLQGAVLQLLVGSLLEEEGHDEADGCERSHDAYEAWRMT